MATLRIGSHMADTWYQRHCSRATAVPVSCKVVLSPSVFWRPPPFPRPGGARALMNAADRRTEISLHIRIQAIIPNFWIAVRCVLLMKNTEEKKAAIQMQFYRIVLVMSANINNVRR